MRLCRLRFRPAFLILSAALWLFGGIAALAEPADIGARVASRRSFQGRLLLIDVRSPKEWLRTGIPAKAVPISMNQPLEAFLRQVRRATNGDKRRPIALICAAGTRSSTMAEALEMDGYLDVVHVKEGMEGSGAGAGWISAGLPIRRLTKRRE